MSKIFRGFRQFSTLSANTSQTDQHNENLKSALSTTNRPLLSEKMVNFGPQTKRL